MLLILEAALALMLSYVLVILIWALFFRIKHPTTPPEDREGDEPPCPTPPSGSKEG